MANRRDLTVHEKLGFVVLILIGSATFVFGYMRLSAGFMEPFEKSGTSTYKRISQLEAEQEQALKETDSDGDGLMDYDELHIFRTSPFLEDSDSDGISDSAEIANSQDPNCPKGRVCREKSLEAESSSGEVAAPPVQTLPSGGVQQQAAPEGVVPAEDATIAIEEAFGDISQMTPIQINERIDRMSSDELRTFLVRLGIPRNMLEEASDDILRPLLQETMEDIAYESAAAQQ